MVHRLISFLKSGNKKVLLKYFYYELKADFARQVNKFMPHTVNLNRDNHGKINLSGQNSRLYGLHRSGWDYAMRNLIDLHNPHGVLMDAFVDRTFSGGRRGFAGYSVPWVGFIHVPSGVPDWFQSRQTNAAIFKTEAWKSSVPYCRGLFTLSEYHRRHLEPLFDFPVENLFHPVEFPGLTWDFEKFTANPDKRIVQTGWWLRRIYSIYLLEVKGYNKIILLKQDADMERHLRLELEHMEEKQRINRKVLDSVTRMNFLSNRRYDNLLSENIVFLDLIDASANNAIIECIARNTPILVNPIEPVVEYLGTAYPFYYHTLEEAAMKAENLDLVQETHRYLVNLPLKFKLSGDYFRESFIHSAIYQSL